MEIAQIKSVFIALVSTFYVLFSFLSFNQEEFLSSSQQKIENINIDYNQNTSNVKQDGKNYPLLEEINKKRSSKSLDKLELKNDLCLIANLRLNEQIKNGKLDDHEGFRNIRTKYPDVAPIFDRYNLIAEFLAYGSKNSQETVSLWGNSANHKKLIEDHNLKYGCAVFKSAYAVAIAAN